MASKEALLNGDVASGGSAGRVTSALLLSAAIGSLQAAQYGFNIGNINAPQKTVCASLGIDPNGWGWSVGVVASFCLAGWASSSVAGGFADRLGRKRFIVLLSLFFIVGGVLSFVSSRLTSSNKGAAFALLVLGRVFYGAGSGAGSVVTPMYLGEIATSTTKGAFGALNQFQIVVWILIAQGVSLGMNSDSLWGPLFGLSGLMGVLCLLAAPLMVESPSWLATHGRRDEARKVLLSIRGYSEYDADQEVAQYGAGSSGAAALNADDEEDSSSGSGSGYTVGQLLRDRTLRMPLIVAVMLQLSQQFSGINAVFYYSTSFFSDAGVNGSLGTVLAGAVNVVSTAVAIPLIERAGRKPLVLLAAGGMLLSAAALTGALLAKDANPGSAEALGYLAIVFVLLFVTFFEFGLGAIPWSIAAEMFPERPRAAAVSVAAAFNWAANTAVGILFPFIQHSLGNWSFVPFAVWLSGTVAFTLFYVPETKGKTPTEVLRWFNKGYAPTPGDV